jgi:heme-degrading monooxygenase HmoA
MVSQHFNNGATPMTTRADSVVVINVFTPKPGALEDFLATQLAALPALRAATEGARGSRLYRAQDGSQAVMVSVFDSAADFKRFSDSATFIAHRAKILPYIESAQPGRYDLVYEVGDL